MFLLFHGHNGKTLTASWIFSKMAETKFKSILSIVYLWLLVMVACNQITAVTGQYVIPLVLSFCHKTWCAVLLEKHTHPDTGIPASRARPYHITHRGTVQWHVTGKSGRAELFVCLCCLPDKISAMWAVGRLSQVGGHELVSVDLMDPSPDGALPPARADPLSEHSLFILVGPGGCRVKWVLLLRYFRAYISELSKRGGRILFPDICIPLLEMVNRSTAAHLP